MPQTAPKHHPYGWNVFAARTALAASGGLTALLLLTFAVGGMIPGEGQLLFVSDRDGLYQLYLLDIARDLILKITRDDSTHYAPALSPDGRQIAFYSDSYPGGIYLINADGSGRRPLVSNRVGTSYQNPAWSPDGRWIALDAYPSDRGYMDIFVVNIESPEISHHVPRGELQDAININPDWSPDGSQIVFHSYLDGDAEIYVMDADGRNARRLTDNMIDDFNASWSPDGREIAYVSLSPTNGRHDIYVIDADGNKPPRRLTRNRVIDSSPAWSPDGRWIAFVSTRDGNYELYLMDRDGQNVRRLTFHPAADLSPAWWP